MPPAGFEPTIRASERQQTHALGLSAAKIGQPKLDDLIYIETCYSVWQTLCVMDSCDQTDIDCTNSLPSVRYNL
jgi:hypothetical protein